MQHLQLEPESINCKIDCPFQYKLTNLPVNFVLVSDLDAFASWWRPCGVTWKAIPERTREASFFVRAVLIKLLLCPRSFDRAVLVIMIVALCRVQSTRRGRTFYANNRWLRRPGPWPGAEAVTGFGPCLGQAAITCLPDRRLGY